MNHILISKWSNQDKTLLSLGRVTDCHLNLYPLSGHSNSIASNFYVVKLFYSAILTLECTDVTKHSHPVDYKAPWPKFEKKNLNFSTKASPRSAARYKE